MKNEGYYIGKYFIATQYILWGLINYGMVWYKHEVVIVGVSLWFDKYIRIL